MGHAETRPHHEFNDEVPIGNCEQAVLCNGGETQFCGQEFAIDTRDLVFAQADNTGTTCVSGISSGQIVDDTTWLVSSPTLLLPLCVLLTCGGLRVSACAGRRCVLEERVLLDRRDEEPDLACEARLKARARLLPCHAFFVRALGDSDCYRGHTDFLAA